MMAKPLKTLKLHYPMIQFLINVDTYFLTPALYSNNHHKQPPKMCCFLLYLLTSEHLHMHKLTYRRIPKVTPPVTFEFCRQKGPLL